MVRHEKRFPLAYLVIAPGWDGWIVERTFAWIDTNRRNSKNFERLNNTSVAMVHLSAIRIMLNSF
ncbi:hypothetical protein E2R66_25040 [Mucilaginibacter psychrotolerans]|uniref:Uncharacterized protein n=1 Tax=Mucilaginibacter psychrotolerans TaxID=1524096 RepID=A0A4Y8S5G2_9SPHI|nr:hypothetical protein E2R66_25040 [Mucilaginibacter psychrotolerans]